MNRTMPEIFDRLFGKDQRTRGYATAIIAIAEAEGVLDTVGDEVFAFAKAVEQNAKLREALTDRALPVENRRSLVQDILGDRANRTELHRARPPVAQLAPMDGRCARVRACGGRARRGGA